MLEKEITEKIKDLHPWGEKIYLKGDIYTPGPLDTEGRWDFIKNFIPKNLEGMDVIDTGCSAGYFSTKMKELGAKRVVGIDFEHYIRQAKFVAEIKGYKDIEFRAQSLYNLDSSEKFNLTLCLGILYYLKYPFLALHKMAQLTTEMILVETECLVNEQDACKMRFIEHTYRNDSTNWWIYGEECLRAMLRSVGFKFVKIYSYPENHATFGTHYHQGLTEEGIVKAKRVLAIGLKKLDPDRIGMLLSEVPELENEIDFNNIDC